MPEIKLGGNFTKNIVKDLSETVAPATEEGVTTGFEKGFEDANKKIQKSNKTIQAKVGIEVDAKEEKKALNQISSLAKEFASDIKEELTETAKGSDATIKKLDKDMDILQKKIDKAGALATQLEKEAKEIDKADTLVKSNTGYKSDKVVKTKSDGTIVRQYDIWKQDEERIEKSRKLNEEQKKDLKDLSIHQKQLNTLKENALNTIDEINKKEEKTEEDIIKQYKAAVNLKKVLEEMEQTKVDISKIIGKDNYDETSKISVPKSIIPNKENVSAKDAVEKYLDDFKLGSRLKQVYNRGLKQKEAEKASYLEDKKFENSQDLNIKDLEEAKKQILEKQEAIAKAEQSIDNQLNNLKQETLNSVEDYLKVADKDTQNTSKKLEAALGKIGTYIGSGGDLDIINNGIDEIIKNNPNLGGKTDKEKELFSWNLEDLKLMLESVEDFKEAINGYFEDQIIEKQIDIQLDDEISKLEEAKKKLQEQKENRERYVKSAQEIGQLASDTIQSGDARLTEQNEQNTEKVEKEIINETINTEVPVSVVPEVEPEQFVGEITEQLKGHSVKVDVEPSVDKSNITPETTQPTLEGNKQYDNSEEISSMSALKQEVDKVTTSVDEKTNAFREEEQVVTGTVQREISELERLSGELVSVRDDIEKITSAITTLPKIDFDVDLSKLNIENIDGAAIASFNTFREQLAGLEAQLNVSNLSEKLVHISEAFEKLSKVDNLENLNTKNLKITPITSLAEKAGSITELVEALNRLKECLDGLKTTSFDKDYFAGLKLTKANVNNMAEMAVALETVGIALQSFDADAKASLSSINELLGKSEDLKNLSSIIKAPKKTKKVKETIDNEPSTANVNKADNISDNISNGTYKKSLDEVTTRFENLNKAVIENKSLTDKLKEAYDDLEKANGVENKIQAYKDFKNELTSVQNELSKLEQKNKGFNLSEKLSNQLEEVQNQYSGMSYLSSSLGALKDKITDIQNKSQEAGADLNGLAQEAKQAFATFNKGVLPSGDFVGSFNNLDEAIEKAKSMVNEYGKVKTELKTPLQVNDNGIAKMTAQVVDLNGELKTLTFVYNDATKSMVKQTTNVRKELSGLPGVIDAVKSKLKDMAVYWTATMFDPTDILYKLREIADVVIDLNTQMTELAKVSGLSIDQLEGRFNDWANTAKDLGATISDTISASADWSRLGYSVDEAEKLAEVSILYKNVGDGIDIDAANESLVSTLQGFQMEASQAESIIDSFNEVSNNFAISSGGIGEALQRSAASFYAANTDLNSAIALITATNSVIQDPTRVGKQHIAYLYSNVMIIKVAILVKSQRWLRPRKDYNICFNY